jgi:hypothetical protein
MLWHMYPHFHLILKCIAIFTLLSMWIWGCCGRDRMVVGFTLHSVPITTDVVSSNLDQGVQHYVISLSVTCDLSVVYTWSSTNKTDRHDITELLLEVALANINVVLT